MILPKKPKVVEEKDNFAIFEIEGLYPGYGLTLGNALRRVLLSSLEGAAITSVQIKGVSHEFSTIDGVMEDVVQIILNLKKIRVSLFSNEPQKITLSAKGEKVITAKDIKENSNVEILNKDAHIATLSSKKSSLEMTMVVERGLGYSPSGTRSEEKLSVGNISLDALFSPVMKVNYEVKDMRVGDRTDYNKLRLYIETDGSLTPKLALKKSVNILLGHLKVVGDLGIDDDGELSSPDDEDKNKDEENETKRHDFLIYDGEEPAGEGRGSDDDYFPAKEKESSKKSKGKSKKK